MTWHETHLRWQALREVEAAASQDLTGALPWTDEYAAIFGTRQGLIDALRHRWNQTWETQMDPGRSEDDLIESGRALRNRHRGVLRVLARHPDQTDGGALADAS